MTKVISATKGVDMKVKRKGSSEILPIMTDSDGPQDEIESEIYQKHKTSDFYRERNAKYKRNKEQKYKGNGFINTKIYLGRDTFERLAEIYEDLLGEKLHYDGKKNIDDLSRVISYCILRLYRPLYIKKGKGDLPDIEPATSREAQAFYDLYQSVAFRRDTRVPDTGFLHRLRVDELPPPDSFFANPQAKRFKKWDIDQVEELLDIESLNKNITYLNKK